MRYPSFIVQWYLHLEIKFSKEMFYQHYFFVSNIIKHKDSWKIHSERERSYFSWQKISWISRARCVVLNGLKTTCKGCGAYHAGCFFRHYYGVHWIARSFSWRHHEDEMCLLGGTLASPVLPAILSESSLAL